MKKAISAIVLATLVTNLTACGTILYPERKGQIDGRIDVGVAVLDGIGLFFFIIPGVIAYAVDFSDGTIYLPGGEYRHHHRHDASLEDKVATNGMVAVHVDKDKLNAANIQEAIFANTGKYVDVTTKNVEVYKVDANGEKVRAAVNPINNG